MDSWGQWKQAFDRFRKQDPPLAFTIQNPGSNVSPYKNILSHVWCLTLVICNWSNGEKDTGMLWTWIRSEHCMMLRSALSSPMEADTWILSVDVTWIQLLWPKATLGYFINGSASYGDLLERYFPVSHVQHQKTFCGTLDYINAERSPTKTSHWFTSLSLMLYSIFTSALVHVVETNYRKFSCKQQTCTKTGEMMKEAS